MFRLVDDSKNITRYGLVELGLVDNSDTRLYRLEKVHFRQR